MRLKPLLALIASIPILAACAPAIEAGGMLPMQSTYETLPANPYLEKKLKVGDVTVFEGAGGFAGQVTADAYREALTNALLMSGLAMRGSESAKYLLDAELLELDQPIAGFSMTVNSKARYRLRESASGKVVYDEVLTLPYTAEFGEALDGNLRLRIATAKALRENITHLVKVLASKSKADLK